MVRGAIRGLAVGLALTLALAGCGGGDDEGTGGSVNTTEAAEDDTTAPSETTEPSGTTETGEETTTTAEETTTTATEVDLQALVEGIDITVDDLLALSDGWAVDDSEDSGDELDLDACLGAAGEIETEAETEGRLFVSEANLYEAAATTTAVFATAEDATAVMDTASTEDFRACAEDVLLEDTDGGSLDSYPQGTRYGDQWVVLGGLADIDGVSAGVDLQLLRTGPIISVVVYLDASGGGEAAAYVVDGIVGLLDQRQSDAVAQLG